MHCPDGPEQRRGTRKLPLVSMSMQFVHIYSWHLGRVGKLAISLNSIQLMATKS